MRRRKSKLTIALATLVILGGVLPWWVRPAKPTISYLGHHKQQDGLLAVFKVENRGHGTFAYFGHGPRQPLHLFGVRTPSGWKPDLQSSLSEDVTITVPDLIAIRPHSSFEFEVPAKAGGSPCAVGVRFLRGEPQELLRQPRCRLHDWLVGLLSVLTRRNRSATEITWSEPVSLNLQPLSCASSPLGHKSDERSGK